MKSLRCILIVVFLLLPVSLVSCKDSEAAEKKTIKEQTDNELTQIDNTQTQTIEPVFVSPMAKEDFLLPLEQFSWEREYSPEIVMLHFTSAVVLDKNNPYDMQKIRQIFVDYGVSIHYIIDRDGTIFCYVPEDRAAWHAGKGTYGDEEKYTNSMNKYSVGIEVVGIGSENDMLMYFSKEEYSMIDKSLVGFTEGQYVSLKELVLDICSRNNIPLDRQHVIAHSDYSEGKTDIGELFDWGRVIE